MTCCGLLIFCVSLKQVAAAWVVRFLWIVHFISHTGATMAREFARRIKGTDASRTRATGFGLLAPAMSIAANIVGRIALVILAFGSVEQTALAAEKAIQLKVAGEALNMLERLDGQPVKSYLIVDTEAVRRIESQFDTLWKNAKRGGPEGPLASSLAFSVILSDGRKVELVAGHFCSTGGEWRHSETVDELTTAILMTIAKDKSLQWRTGAMNTKYPTKEEKEVLIKRMVERLVEESRKNSK